MNGRTNDLNHEDRDILDAIIDNAMLGGLAGMCVAATPETTVALDGLLRKFQLSPGLMLATKVGVLLGITMGSTAMGAAVGALEGSGVVDTLFDFGQRASVNTLSFFAQTFLSAPRPSDQPRLSVNK